MAKLLRTNGVGSAQTTAETQDSKEKVYADLASAEADIANIAENEFVDTLDEEVVKEGDIATKSWAVGHPDYARGQLNSSSITTYTATEDCIAVIDFFRIRAPSTSDFTKLDKTIIQINGVKVAGVIDSGQMGVTSDYIFCMCSTLFLKKGDTMTVARSDGSTDVYSLSTSELYIWGLIA